MSEPAPIRAGMTVSLIEPFGPSLLTPHEPLARLLAGVSKHTVTGPHV